MKRSLITALLVCLTCAPAAAQRLSLENAVDEALKSNLDIRVSRVEKAVASTNNTLGNAGMLPTLTATGAATVGTSADKQKTAAGAVSTTHPSELSTSLGVVLNWTLYDGGKMFVTRQRLQELERMGDLRYRSLVQETLYGVVTAYYNVVRVKQQLVSAEQTVRYNQERVVIAEAGFRSGATSRQDVLQASIDLNESKEAVLLQQSALRDARRSLNLQLGRDPLADLEVEDSIPNGYAPDRDALLLKLETRNADLVALKNEVEVSRLAWKETQSNFLPKFSLSAGYYASQRSMSDASLRSSSSVGPEATGTLSIPLYRGGENQRQRRVAELGIQASETNLAALRLEVRRTLLKTLDDFTDQKSLLEIEQANCAMAKEHLELAIQRQRLGETTSLEVHQAMEYFTNSNTRLINYRYGLKVAETKLRQLVSDVDARK
jgi:outer membrane protein TolC